MIDSEVESVQRAQAEGYTVFQGDATLDDTLVESWH